MAVTQPVGGAALSNGLNFRNTEWNARKKPTKCFCQRLSTEVRNCFMRIDRNKLRYAGVGAPIDRKSLRYKDDAEHYYHLNGSHMKWFFSKVNLQRKPVSFVVSNQFDKFGSEYSVDLDVEEKVSREIKEHTICKSDRTVELTEHPASQVSSHGVKLELIMLSLPAIAGQAIDPLAQLMETAYIGRLGSLELASAGVSISIFNIVSKLFNIPLLSVATSFVAEDISKNANKGAVSEETTDGKPYNSTNERKQLHSVSTALLLAVVIGIFEALALSLGSGLFLKFMGISSDSPMYPTALRFLSLRALGAPAVVVSLALQGVLRGFKDTKTPVICLGIGNVSAVFLFPILMYYFRLGVTGAAISTVLSQYIVTFLMIWYLNKRAVLLPPKLTELQFGSYIKSGGFLIGRTLSALFTMTLSTSMAARQGPIAMAAHQICLQVWLAVSLLTDALAASGQALVASSLSKGDYKTVKEITFFVLKTGFVMGGVLAVALGVSFDSLAVLFTRDTEVLGILKTGVLFVSASQPLNALAFIFDGLHYGVSDFPYAASSMITVGAISSAILLYAPSIFGLRGVWLGLALFMGLRMVAGFIRLASKNGPWWFLHADLDRTSIGGYT